jgi:arabinose-5-phosphate isomerase
VVKAPESGGHLVGKGRTDADLVDTGKQVVRIEAEEIRALEQRLDGGFARAVRMVMDCVENGGKVIVTGLGKSGLVGKKIAATMNSTGTSAFFLHPVEAAHGDLGMVSGRDIVIAISKSGRSEELAALLPTFRRLGTPIVALAGDPHSDLARESDVVLDVSVSREACPFDLAPTASSSCALAVGDALAITVFVARGLEPEDFAFHHPGGALGRRLLLKVGDIMHTGEAIPLVSEEATLMDALLEIIEKRLGVTGVVSEEGRLVGIITDGDIKRILVKHAEVKDIHRIKVRSVMTPDPRTIDADALVASAIQRMEADRGRLITSLMIVDDHGFPEGIIHMHDCLQAGIA